MQLQESAGRRRRKWRSPPYQPAVSVNRKKSGPSKGRRTRSPGTGARWAMPSVDSELFSTVSTISYRLTPLCSHDPPSGHWRSLPRHAPPYGLSQRRGTSPAPPFVPPSDRHIAARRASAGGRTRALSPPRLRRRTTPPMRRSLSGKSACVCRPMCPRSASASSPSSPSFSGGP